MSYQHRFSSHRLRNSVVVAALCVLLLFNASSNIAQSNKEAVDAAEIAKIRDEAFNHSQVMDTAGYLTDVIGPRLTGSPNIKRGQEYAVKRLTDWGISNAHLESWGPFGRGWTLEGFAANMTAPMFSPLIAYPKAWSPGTAGAIRGEVVFLDISNESDLEKYKGKLKGKIVLISPVRTVLPNFQPQAPRSSDEELLKLANATAPEEQRRFEMSPQQRASAELNYKKWQLVYSEEAAVILEAAGGDAGTVYVTSAIIPSPIDVPYDKRPHSWDLNKPVVIPQVAVAAEHYNRIIRLLAKGVPVQLEINITSRFYDEDPMSYNIVAEIPGTDLKNEIVMIGGCFDSWHAGTGATDNASGAAVAMEVLRIIKSLGLQPRRTIRIGLWSGEEQGRFGSKAYVAQHLAIKPDSTHPNIVTKPEYNNFSVYFNLDYGAGKLRGIYMQGNEAVRPVFRSWLAPLQDLGASTLTIQNIGSADHMSFDEVGLPGFQFIRDFMEFNTRTAHTNMDLYDHLSPEDLKQSSAVAASLIYAAAMRNEKMPRKTHAE